ncbi:MAG: NFYB/HAP3 family transcription factor subunit [Euryarchaeota archaeon]|nr:NFYB/HAP3 family transcription factor subunit [Euryarchaeota archaeon]
MEIGISTIKRIMKKGTSHPISTDAAYWLSESIEKLIVKKTRNAQELLAERNRQREKGGLPTKKRISKELIKEVMKGDSAS